MGFVKPHLPAIDYDEWRAKPRAERLHTMVVDWASAGFGTPDSVYALYALKIAGYLAAAVFFVALTPGIGGFGEVARWWTEPIVFEKVVLWTLLLEVGRADRARGYGHW